MKKIYGIIALLVSTIIIVTTVGVAINKQPNNNDDLSDRPVIIVIDEQEEIYEEVHPGDSWNEANIPSQPLKEGYEFVGWYNDSEYKTPASFYGKIERGTKLYAKFLANSYDIIFETNGGSSLPNYTGLYDVAIPLPNEPLKTGYVLEGWYQDPALKELFDFSKMPIGGATIYASWKAASISLQVTNTHLQWKYTNSTTWTNLVALSLITGADGISITDVSINDLGILIVTFSDGTTKSVGDIVGADGVGIVNVEINSQGELVITLTSGETCNVGVVVGTSGREVVLRMNNQMLEWCYHGTNDWHQLYDVSTLQGSDGLSAYEIAVENGYLGTEAAWLNSLLGLPGLSAYEVAIKNGYLGTETEWLTSLIGPRGIQGLSAYEVAIANGYQGTVSEWLASLIGNHGMSAYEEAVANGYQGTASAWLASLVGDQGLSAYEVAKLNGFTGSEAEWLSSLAGSNGKSAYELAVDQGFNGTIEQWLLSLKGHQIELRVENGYIEWRYAPLSIDDPQSDEFKWTPLIALASLTGRGITSMSYNAEGLLEVFYSDETSEIINVTVPRYTISYYGFQDSLLSVNDVIQGEIVPERVAPVIVGYDFIDWYVDSTYKTLADFTKPVTENMNFYARYQSKKFQVTFKGFDDLLLSTIEVEYGNNVTFIEAPVVEGYTFVRWDQSGTNITNNLTIRAQYVKVPTNAYLVVFEDMFGAILKVETVTYGENATLPTLPTIPKGYINPAWDGNYENVTKNEVVILRYDLIKYQVSFMDGLELIQTVEVPYGMAALAPNVLVKTGFTFKGWDKSFDQVTDHMTVKALYEQKQYMVTFLNQKGSIEKIAYVLHGDSVDAPTLLEVTGYTFKGWDKSLDNITSDTTIKPQYEVNVYRVKYFDGEGQLIGTAQSINHGDDAILPASPTKVGYTFVKWSYSHENISNDLEILPIFIRNSYTITFKNYDGAIIEVKNVLHSDALTDIPVVVTRVGYTNARWNVSDFSNITSDMIIVPVDQVIEYTVTFKMVGASDNVQTIAYGQNATLPSVPPRVGYDFIGWNNDYTNIQSNVTLEAMYVAHTFEVAFVDFDGRLISLQKVSYAENATVPDSPVRPGYTFRGWDQTATNIQSNLVIKATYSQDTFKVTFKDYDSTNLKVIAKVPYGTAASAPSNPLRVGYTFTGWNTAFDKVTSDLIIIAMYVQNEYTINFMDGYHLLKTIKVNYQYLFTQAEANVAPEKEGYSFDKWYLDENLTNAYSFGVAGQLITTDITLYARYTKNTYMVTFDLNGGTLASFDTTQAVTHGENTVLPKENPTKLGYTFVCWDNDGANILGNHTIKAIYEAVLPNEYIVVFKDQFGTLLSVQVVAHGASATPPAIPAPPSGYENPEWIGVFTNITANEIVVLTYQTITYEVTFVADGMENLKVSVPYGASVTPPIVPSKAGYTFVGWDKSCDYITNAITIKALYEKNEYTVTFKDDNGHIIKIETVAYQQDATLPNNPERIGYTFDCWQGAYTNVTSNQEVVASYKINTYVVNFEVDGVVINTQNIDYNQFAIPPKEPLKTGYQFIGWNLDLTHVTSDMNIKAIFAIKTFKVIFIDYNNYVLKEATVSYGMKAIAPVNPTRKGYAFMAWDQDFSNVTSDLVVKATYQISSYQVTFKLDGITITTVNVNYLESAQAPTDPVKLGYTFRGWDQTFTNVQNDLIVNAVMTVNNYPVTFVDYNGYLLSFQLVNYGTAVTLPTTPNRLGYTFKEWSVVSGANSHDNITTDTIIEATYTINSYSVSFFAEGRVLYQTLIPHGGKVEASFVPTVPTKTGYQFIGWDKNYDCVTEALTINAIYEVIKLKVTFVDYNGAIIKEEVVNYNFDAAAPIVPSRLGYKDGTWNNNYLNVLTDQIVEATYTKITYQVQFLDANDVKIASAMVDEGGNARAPINPIKVGYDFIGWDQPYLNVQSDLTIRPVFGAKQFQVSYFDENGLIVFVNNAQYGQKISQFNMTNRLGYTFTGWYKDANLTTLWNFTSDYITGPTNLYAGFVASDVTLIFMNEGQIFDKIIIKYDEPLITPSLQPVSEGKTFQNWKLTSTNHLDDYQYVAEYAVNQYTVTFLMNDGKLINTQVVSYNQMVMEPMQPNINGKSFKGWYLDPVNENDPFVISSGIKQDYSVYAHYEDVVDAVTVTYKTQFGYIIDIQVINKGTNATAPKAPSIDGYTFNAWSDNGQNVITDKVIVASYNINQYTVKFYNKNGVIVDTQIVNYGTKVTAPTLAAINGYEFRSWDKPFTFIREDLDIYPRYEVSLYTVTIVDKDGKLINEQQVVNGNLAKEPAVPTFVGFAFDKWLDESGDEFLFNTPITKNQTIKANYYSEAIISFVSYKSLRPFSQTLIVKIGETIPQLSYGALIDALKAITDSNMEFVEFIKQSDGTVFDINQVVLENTTYIATYKGISLEVNLIDEGITTTYDTYQYNDYVVIPNTYVLMGKVGHHFVGWFIDETFTKPFNFETPLRYDTTLYAKYEIDYYKVTIMDENNHIYSIQNVGYGKNAITPALELTGYNLSWYTIEAGNEKLFTFETAVSKDLTIYAKWNFQSPIINLLHNYTKPLEFGDDVIRLTTNMRYSYNNDVTVTYEWVNLLDVNTVISNNPSLTRYEVAHSGQYQLKITLNDSSKNITNEFTFDSPEIVINKLMIDPTFYKNVNENKTVIENNLVNLLYGDITTEVAATIRVPVFAGGSFNHNTLNLDTVYYTTDSAGLNTGVMATTATPGKYFIEASTTQFSANWGVQSNGLVARIVTTRVNNDYYYTLDEAYAASVFGDTIYVEASTTLNNNIRLKRDSTLYVNAGATITGTGSIVSPNNTLVVEQMKFIGLEDNNFYVLNSSNELVESQLNIVTYLLGNLASDEIIVPYTFPFESYELNNIQVDLTIEYGSEYSVTPLFIMQGMNIEQFGMDITTVVPPIVTKYENEDTEGIILLHKGASFIKSYNSATKRSTIAIDGDADTGLFAAAIILTPNSSGSALSKDVMMEKEDFPFKLKGNIDVVLRNGNFNIGTSIEYLDGSTVLIEPTAVVNLNGVQYYHNFMTGSSIINNGTLFVNGIIGGNMLTTSENARIIFSTNATVDGTGKVKVAQMLINNIMTDIYRSPISKLVGNIDGNANTTFNTGVDYISVEDGNSYKWVLAELLITAQADNNRVNYGTTITMATNFIDHNATNISYQWYKDGVVIDGAESNTLIISDVNETGLYYVKLVVSYQTYTKEGTSNIINVTINKANPLYTTPSNLFATYGTNLANVTLPSGWSWKETLNTLVGNVGPNTFKAVYTPTDMNNYNVVDNFDLTIEVIKAIPSYTIPSSLKATYLDLLSSVVLPSGWTWTADRTTLVGNAGTNQFEARFTPVDFNNFETVTTMLSVTIGKKAPTITVVNSPTFTYDGTEHIITAGASLDHAETSLIYTNNKVQNAGTHQVTIIALETLNYSSAQATMTVVIDKANALIDPTNLTNSFVYDGTAHQIKGAKLNHNETDIVYSIETVTKAGTYTVKVNASSSNNYRAAPEVEVLVEVSKGITTINLEKVVNHFTYTGSVFVLTGATINHNEATTITYSVYNDAALINAGNYLVTFRATETSNYQATTAQLAVVISKAEQIIDTSNIITTLTYNGADQTFARASLNNLEGTLNYSFDSVKNAGTYELIITASETTNYKETISKVSIKVMKAQTVINTTNIIKEYTYDGQTHEITTGATLEPLVSLEERNIMYVNNTYKNAGAYKLLLIVIATDNFEGTIVEVSFTVKKAQSILIANNYATYYSNTPVAPLISVNHTESEPVYSYRPYESGSYIAGLPINCNNYQVKVFIPASFNYEASEEIVCLVTIMQATGEVLADDVQHIVYTGHEITPIATSNVVGVPFAYKYRVNGTANDYVVGKPTLVGEYEVVISMQYLSTNTNYSLGNKTITLFIDRAPSVITVANEVNGYLYLELNGHSQTILTSLNHSEATIFTYPTDTFTNVGSYTIMIMVPESTNYASQIKELTVVIGIVKVTNNEGKRETYVSIEDALTAAEDGDTLTLLDNITLSNNITLPTGVTLNTSAYELNIDSSATLTNYGTINYESTSHNIQGTLTNYGTINILASATLVNNGTINNLYDGSNNGQINIAGVLTHEVSSTFVDNSNTIYVKTNGLLNLHGDVTGTGSVVIEAGGKTIDWTAETIKTSKLTIEAGGIYEIVEAGVHKTLVGSDDSAELEINNETLVTITKESGKVKLIIFEDKNDGVDGTIHTLLNRANIELTITQANIVVKSPDNTPAVIEGTLNIGSNAQVTIESDTTIKGEVSGNITPSSSSNCTLIIDANASVNNATMSSLNANVENKPLESNRTYESNNNKWFAYYTITLNLNGKPANPGSLNGAETSYIVKFDDNITLPNATRTGYDFVNWNGTADAGTVNFEANVATKYSLEQDITLFAKWNYGAITINLGADIEVIYGNEVQINPIVNPVSIPGTIFTYTWSKVDALGNVLKDFGTTDRIETFKLTDVNETGRYEFKVIVDDGENTETKRADLNIVITKKALEITINNSTKGYGETDPIFTGTARGWVYSDTDALLIGTLSRTNATENSANTYTDVLTSSYTNNNYEITINKGDFIVTKKALEITINNSTKVYGETDPIFTGTARGWVYTDTDALLIGTLSRTNATENTVNVYTDVLTSSYTNNNYEINVNKGDFIITKKALEITINNSTKVYGETDPIFTGTARGWVYSDTDTLLIGTLSRTNATENTANTYTDVLTSSYTNNNYEITISKGDFIVTKKALEITINNSTKVYGETDPIFTGTANGWVYSDTDALLIGTLSRTNVTENTVNVYNDVLTSNYTNNNYDISVVSGDFTITKKALEITINNSTKVYGETDPIFTGTANGWVYSDTDALLIGTISRTNATENTVNVYNDVLTSSYTNNNYEITINKGDFIVTKKALEITINNSTKVYGETDPIFTGTARGWVYSDTDALLIGTFSRTNATENTVNVYNDVLTSSYTNNNYAISVVSGDFTITKKALEITVNYSSKIYGETDPTFTAWASGWAYNDTDALLIGTLSRTNATENSANTYPDVLTSSYTNNNYEISINKGNFTIRVKLLTITVNDSSKVYGETDPIFTGTAQGWSYEDNDDLLIGSFYRFNATVNTNVNVYTDALTSNYRNSNYSIIVNKGIFTITKKALVDSMIQAIDDINYTGNQLTPIPLVIDGIPSIITTADYEVTYRNNINVGKATAIITATLNGNYRGNASVDFNINKATTIITFVDNQVVTYNAEAQTPVYNCNVHDVPTYTYKLISEELYQNGLPIVVGTYNVIISYAETINYSRAEEIVQITIKQADITVTADNTIATYNATSHTGTKATAGGVELVNGHVVKTVTISGSGINYGTYALTPSNATIKDASEKDVTGNYNITYRDGTLTVNKATITVTANNVTQTYNNISYTGTDATASGDELVNGHAVKTVTISGSGINYGTYALTPSNATIKDASEKDVTGNYNITYRDGTLTINKANYNMSTVSFGNSMVIYSGSPQSIMISGTLPTGLDGEQVSVTYDNNENVNKGTYTVIANFATTSINYNAPSSMTATITIDPQEVSVVWNVGTLVYTGSELKPSATATSIQGENVSLNIVGAITAGTHTASATTANPNFTLTNQTVSFTIDRAFPTITTNPIASDIYEGGQSTISGGVANTGGIFTISNTITELYTGTASTWVFPTNYVFAPTDTNNYKEYTGSINVTMKPVAYIGTAYYGTIEKAVNAAISGDIIYVIVGITTTIKENITIVDGVTLTLPYDGENYLNREGSPAASNVFADGSITGINTNRKIKVNVANNVTITVAGRLNIGGILGDTSNELSGHTSSSYAEMTLGANSKIISTGIIDCVGYIKETSANNGSIVQINAGTVYEPFVVYDFRGGSVTSANHSKPNMFCVPFNIFDMPNIQTTFDIYYGASLIGYADLYASSQHNLTVINLVGTENCLINLNQGSHLRSKYHPSYSEQTPITSTSRTSLTENFTTMNFYGGASTSGMQLTAVGQVVDTKEMFFAYSFKYRITLNDGTYTLAQKYKLLPGHQLTVASDAILNLTGSMIVYESFIDAFEPGGPYPQNQPAGKFIVNGTFNANNFAGLVQSTSDGACMNISGSTTVTSNEINTSSGSGFFASCTHQSIVKNFTVYLFDGTSISVAESNAPIGDYISRDGGWYSTKCIIYYDANGGILTGADSEGPHEIGVSGYTIAAINTTDPTRVNYTFGGWYTDINCTKNIIGYTAFTSTYAYAKWVPINYQIDYLYDYQNCSTSGTIINSNATTYNVEQNIVLASAIDGNLVFDGWYLDASHENRISSLLGINYSGELILYGVWYPAGTSTYTVNYVTNNPDYSRASDYIVSFNASSYALPNFSDRDNDETYAKYFVNWYTDEACTNLFTSLTESCTLYAKWGDKYLANVSFYAADIELSSQVYRKPGSLFTVPTHAQISNVTKIGYEMAGWIVEGGLENGNVLLFGSTNVNLSNTDNDNVSIKGYYVKNIIISIGAGTTITIKDETGVLLKDLSGMDISGRGTGTVTGKWPEGQKFAITVAKTGSYTNPTFTVAYSNGVKLTAVNGFYTVTGTELEIKISASSTESSGCIAAGSLITLADGSTKLVENLSNGDIVLVFNHETGLLDYAPIITTVHQGENVRLCRIINLNFSNGETIKVINMHGFYNLDLNEYVYIDEYNVGEYIGHSFYSLTDKNEAYESEAITLSGYSITEEYTNVYSPLSAYHLNLFVNDVLTITSGISGLFNIFEYDDNLKFSQELMLQDINKYGMYSYDDFKDYVSYEIYSAFPAKYWKVAVGKGMITWEGIEEIIHKFVVNKEDNFL